jgi:hypothetical protein
MGRSWISRLGNVARHGAARSHVAALQTPRMHAPIICLGIVLPVLGIAAATLPVPARAEVVWSRWSGAWEVALDRQADGATCLWPTYDAPPPGHVRRLTFAVNRRKEIVVIVSDRREPIHRIASSPGPSALLTLGGRLHTVENGTGVPLAGLPGGMLIGRLKGQDAERFARSFGQHDGEEARLVLPFGWSWRVSLRGAAVAAEEVASCMAEAAAQGRIR